MDGVGGAAERARVSDHHPSPPPLHLSHSFPPLHSPLTQRNTSTENKTRIIKLTSLDGEYRLLARATADTSNIFLQYGDGATRTFNITGGAGIQEAEFVDGLRLAVRSPQPLRLNAALASGVDPAALPAGTRSLCKASRTFSPPFSLAEHR